MRFVFHLTLILGLTLLTQIGGIAWALALFWRHRVFAFLASYLLLSFVTWQVAPLMGRAPLPCGFDEGPLRMQSWVYCLAHRNYVTPELASVAEDLAGHMARSYPYTVTLALDGSFPFVTGFPLLPHLSHDDGEKLDLAFYYADAEGRYLQGATRSPLGYFAFEEGASACPLRRLTLRWDFDWLQGLFPSYRLEPARMREMLNWLAADPRVGRIFVEPHLRESLGLASEKFGFQGCRAARHDDHVHFQL